MVRLQPSRLLKLVPPADGAVWSVTLAGSVLAFFTFIGVEDMVKIAEEVKGVRRTLPVAIILTLCVTTVLYMLVAVVAVIALPIETLSGAEAPLALLFTQATGSPPTIISLIAIVTVLSGALIRVIMVSRVLYGLSREGWLPTVICSIYPHTQTPLVATVIVLTLTLWLPLITLAPMTSITVLVVYGTVNLPLWRIKRRNPKPEGVITFPIQISVAGFFCKRRFYRVSDNPLAKRLGAH